MIAREDRQRTGLVPCAMGEGVILLLEREGRDDAVMGDSAEREDGTQIRHDGDFGDKELAAGTDLDGQWLVLRRHAADRIGDARPDKLKSVIGLSLIGPSRQTVALQRTVEQVTCIIAGEGTAGAVGAFQSWRQPNDEERRIQRAETRDRIVEEAGMLATDPLTELGPSRT